MTLDVIDVSHADARAPDRAGMLQLYGQFVGDWDTPVITHSANGEHHAGQGEIHLSPRLQDRRADVRASPANRTDETTRPQPA